ncbi:MAG TPA: sulfatase-like hydrolase/transferase [Thermogutta sp.]|nr:sulfatase-like hydrolase/transferase [Thermogutta sp.]HQF13635.1 sulfatase-like hydrolase/transferase [Thermogutta sp.]
MLCSRIGIVLCLVVGMGAAWLVDVAQADQDVRPNLLVILADDLGWGDLGCFGSSDLQTPHIDRLAREGMRMLNFYANCPVCSPTRASLLTGYYPDVVGVPGVIRTHSWNSWGYLNPKVELLPNFLAKAGYDTALVGKWHLGLDRPNIPTARGFTYFHGFLGDMMDDYWNHRRHGINYLRENEQEIDPPGHATDLFTEWACQYIRRHHQTQPNRPFFLYLAYNAPHVPIQPPEEALNRYRQRHPDAPEKRSKLAALIEHMDAGIGRVLQTLDELGLTESTLVVFTSDNGGQLDVGANNGPWRSGKGTMYEGGIRVPMVVRWPNKIQANSQSEAIALTMDLFPSLLEAAGVEPPTDRDGVSLLPIWLGKAEDLLARELFWVRLEGNKAGFSYAIRRGKYKLIRPAPTKSLAPIEVFDQLYDLEADPYEKQDLAPQQPQLLSEMRRLLENRIKKTIDVPWRDEQGLGPGEIAPQ